jgi:predicted ATP-grasp superfamily ATP-dependent carboligase
LTARVLVLDGEQRSALAVTRSLVRHNCTVYVASCSANAIATASRGVNSIFKLPSPVDTIAAFSSQLERCIAEQPFDLVMPITDTSSAVLNAIATAIETSIWCRIERGPYERLTDKAHLLESAARVAVPAPRSAAASTVAAALVVAADIGYPVILKPGRSKILRGDHVIATSVRLAKTPDDLVNRLSSAVWLSDCPVVVQQFIPGHGAGVFCLYDRDHAIAWFAHRRIREKPPSGGVSVLCESVAVDPVLKDYAERLLRAAEYRGVAMVEFRIGADGRPYLMEVNARFWGSLQLAIDCGVDFPWLYYQMLMGEQVTPVQEYQVGRRLRWWLGDLDHVLLQVRNPALGVGEKMAVVGRFLGTSFDPRCRQEVFRWSDPGPGWLELRQWVAGVLGRPP